MTRGLFAKTFQNFFDFMAADLIRFFPKEKIEIKGKEIDGGVALKVSPEGLDKLLKKGQMTLRESSLVNNCKFTFSGDEIILMGENAFSTSCIVFLLNHVRESLLKKRADEIEKKKTMARSRSIKYTFKAIINQSGHRVKNCSLTFNPSSDKFQLEITFLVKKMGRRNNTRKMRISNSNMKNLIEKFKMKIQNL
jgi:hypothetical protein